MNARCSLDDFIRNNTHPVLVDEFSRPVKFQGVNYVVPPGALFDLRVLYGHGFQLESKNMREGTDLTKGVGLAYILDQEGKSTGYALGSQSSYDPAGKLKRREYKIEDVDVLHRGIHAPDFVRRHRVAQKIWRNESELRRSK